MSPNNNLPPVPASGGAGQPAQASGGGVPASNNPPAQPAQTPIGTPNPPAGGPPAQTPVSTPKPVAQQQDSGKPDQTPKQLLVERVKEATNILITVGKNPSVDQLSSAIGLSLILNKMDKHATAVVSGQVPDAIQFLEPDKLLKDNVDNLRDFIISLDKEKADKLRYKVEDNIVKIFITPYQHALSDKDLVFSQGDVNVELIIALGVNNKGDLDEAIAAHGKILHDATIITINAAQQPSSYGSINWNEPTASSIAEMLVSVSEAFQGGLLDQQISNSLLTGIVAATDRFSAKNTTPKVMTMSAQLMAAGANQQLIVDNLDKSAQDALRQQFAGDKSQKRKNSLKNAAKKESKQQSPADGVEIATFDHTEDSKPAEVVDPSAQSAQAPQGPVELSRVASNARQADLYMPSTPPVANAQPKAPKPEIIEPPSMTALKEQPSSTPITPPTLASEPISPQIKPEVAPGLVKSESSGLSLADSLRPEPSPPPSPQTSLEIDPITGKPRAPLANVPPSQLDAPEIAKNQPSREPPVISATASEGARKMNSPPDGFKHTASPLNPLSTPPPPPSAPAQSPVVAQSSTVQPPVSTDSQRASDSEDAARDSVAEALRAVESAPDQPPPTPVI